MTHAYQVVIIGAGLAGSCLALTLSQRSQGTLSIALIDSLAIDPLSVESDERAIALTYASCQQLVALGMMSEIDSATAINSVQISEAGHSGFGSFQAADYQLPWLGKVLPMPLLRQQLMILIRRAAGITLYAPCAVAALTLQHQQAQVVLMNGEIVTGHLAVMATGNRAKLLPSSALRYQCWDHHQQALVATLETAEPHQGCAFERFTADGSVAVVPKNAQQSTLIWCQATAHQQTLLSQTAEVVLQQLQQIFGWRLGELLQVGRYQCFSLKTEVAERPWGHRWVAIGNAAQTLHPIAAQGFNMALRDVRQLADSLVDIWQQQQDIGSYQHLSAYWRQRQHEQQRMLVFTRGLLKLFGSQQPGIVFSRNWGLRLWDSCPQLKRSLLAGLLGTAV